MVFWQVLHYTSGHALGLAGGFGAFAVFVAVPLLFQTNRPKVPAATAGVVSERTSHAKSQSRQVEERSPDPISSRRLCDFA